MFEIILSTMQCIRQQKNLTNTSALNSCKISKCTNILEWLINACCHKRQSEGRGDIISHIHTSFDNLSEQERALFTLLGELCNGNLPECSDDKHAASLKTLPLVEATFKQQLNFDCQFVMCKAIINQRILPSNRSMSVELCSHYFRLGQHHHSYPPCQLRIVEFLYTR